MKNLLCTAAALCLCTAPGFAATKILFIGNNITFGASSFAQIYHPEVIHDLNPPDPNNARTKAGIPSIFKLMTEEAGLNYDVSEEAIQNTQLDFHYEKKRNLIDKPWDFVVANTYTTLSQQHPGDPAELIAIAKKMGDMFYAKNPNVKFYLISTWPRADLTLGSKAAAEAHEARTGRDIDHDSIAPWFGKPVQQMGKDLEAGTEAAANASGSHVAGVVPMALAFNAAIDTGIARPNPYLDTGALKMNLWATDAYHGSIYTSYLEALMDFGRVTGHDPQSLHDKNGREQIAADFGLSVDQRNALQKVAHDTLAAQGQRFVTVINN